jgi:hypothetical protein
MSVAKAKRSWSKPATDVKCHMRTHAARQRELQQYAGWDQAQSALRGKRRGARAARRGMFIYL